MNALKGFKFLIEKPFRILFVISGLTLFFGLSVLHSCYEAKDYLESTGEICNVEQVRVLRRQQYVTRYNYDLVWYGEGELHKKHFNEEIDYREEGEVTIWVRPDNRHVLFAGPAEMKANAPIYLTVSLLTGILAFVLYYIHAVNRRESRTERD